jgi:cell wall-associated NlpC family hydrolase
MKRSSGLIILGLYVLASCTSTKPTTTTSLTSDGTKKVEVNASPTKKANSVIQAARKYMGTTYKYGGMDRHGMDCSGLVCNAFKEVDITLPHQSAEMSEMCKSLKIYDLQPGDLIFMGATKGSKKVTHVGIVTSVSSSKIMFIHASTKRGVVEENLLEKWYEPLFIKGGRIL